MVKKRKIIFTVIVCLLFLLIGMVLYIFAEKYYFPKVILSGRFKIQIEGMEKPAQENIKIYGYTPFGKIYVLSKEKDSAVWSFNENDNLNSLFIFQGDSVRRTIGIIIIISERKIVIKNTELFPLESTDISKKIKPTVSKWNILNKMLYRREAKLLGIATLTMLFIYLASWFFFKRYKRIDRKYKLLWFVFIPIFLFHFFFFVYTGFYLVTSGLCLLIIVVIIAHAIIRIVEILKKKKMQNVRLLVFSLMLLIFLLELVFIITGVKSTSLEQRFRFYYSTLNKNRNKGYYHTWNANHYLSNQEYSFFRILNTEKLSDKEHPIKKSTNEYRIIGLGDSFTEGDGAHADSTWLKFLERSLKKYPLQKKLTFINAGVCGSDPVYSYVLLRDKLLKYKPDLVLLAINASDINDIFIRGGMERFKPDGTVKYKHNPWWEPLYAMSRISRLFFSALGYNELLIKESEDISKYAKEQIMLILDKYNSLAFQNNFKFIVIFHPFRGEIDSREQQFEDIILQLRNKKQTETIDLLEYFINVEHIDSSNSFHYFWKKDGHYNAKGYELFARGLEWKLRETGIIDSLMIK